MKTYSDDPNFSIFVPGGCNADCAFCFNKDRSSVKSAPIGDYLKNLSKTLSSLDPRFFQISLTGGEPLISPYFDSVLGVLIPFKQKYTNIVLTTNGTNLLEKAKIVSVVVDHINVSRHHYSESQNNHIFGGSFRMSDKELLEAVDVYGSYGVDISLNCVINEATDLSFIDEYIKWARNIGVKAIHFRAESGDLSPLDVEDCYASYKAISDTKCPVCRTKTQLIKGVEVQWKNSVIEPSESFPAGTVYELIYQPDGKVYADWNMKEEINLSSKAIPAGKKKPLEEELVALQKQDKKTNHVPQQASSKLTGVSGSVVSHIQDSCGRHKETSKRQVSDTISSCGGSSHSGGCH